jgi:hypothetical protein
MKNTIKLIAIAAIIGLAMTACPNEPEDEDSADPTKLRLSDLPVTFEDETPETDFGYKWDFDEDEIIPLGDLITGTPKAQITGTGAGRKLAIELDAPFNVSLKPITKWLAEGVTPTPKDAKIFELEFGFNTSDGNYYIDLYKLNSICFLIYADRAVTINGGTGMFKYENVSLDKGWHFLYGTQTNNIFTLTASKTPPDGYTWTVFAL